MKLEIKDKEKYRIFKLEENIAWDDARNLDKDIENSVDNDNKCHLVFDLTGVTFICSGGVGALIYNLNKVRKRGGNIYLIYNEGYVDFIFQTLKFNVIFNGFIFNSWEDFSNKNDFNN